MEVFIAVFWTLLTMAVIITPIVGLLGNAFRDGGWGICCLLIPFVLYFYVYKHWNKNRKLFYFHLASFPAIFLIWIIAMYMKENF
jgi:hypothetical protein